MLLTGMDITLFSFGYKHAPPDADTVIDVRFLPNPYYEPELSPGTGRDKQVAEYVLKNHVAELFFVHFIPFLQNFITSHDAANRSAFRLAIGCTGGRHRSVAVAEKIKEILVKNGLDVQLTHRDIDKM